MTNTCTAKFAINGSSKSASRKYGIPLTTFRGFVKSYKEKTSNANDNDEISELPQKKRGRRTLLPEEIDEKVTEMAQSMHLTGVLVNYNVLIVIAKGILIANRPHSPC